jgi:hypothetical protein
VTPSHPPVDLGTGKTALPEADEVAFLAVGT